MGKTIDLSNYAVLATLSVSLPPGMRADKAATEEVAHAKDADVGHTRVNKEIYPKKRLKELKRAVSELRAEHEASSLPWPLGGGRRMVPLTKLNDYQKAMQAAKAEVEKEMRRFVQNHDVIKQEAKQLLGKLYDENDYLSTDELERRLKVELVIEQAPNVHQLDEVTSAVLDDATRKQMREALEALQVTAIARSVAELADALADRLRRVGRYIGGEGKRFNASLLETMRRTVEMFDHLPNDMVPDEMRQDVKRAKAFLDAYGSPEKIKALKKSEHAGAKAAEGLGKMADRLDAIKKELGV